MSNLFQICYNKLQAVIESTKWVFMSYLFHMSHFNEVLHLSDSRILSWKIMIGLIFSKHYNLSFEKCVSIIWTYELSNDGSTSGPALLWSLFNWITCQLCIFLKSYFELFLYLHIMNNATNTANTWMNFLVFILLLQLNIGFL